MRLQISYCRRMLLLLYEKNTIFWRKIGHVFLFTCILRVSFTFVDNMYDSYVPDACDMRFVGYYRVEDDEIPLGRLWSDEHEPDRFDRRLHSVTTKDG